MNPQPWSPEMTTARSSNIAMVAGIQAETVIGSTVSIHLSHAVPEPHMASKVLPHKDYLASLSGTDRFLRRKSLRFIMSEGNHRVHPRRILDHIEGGRHVLITGPAGSGKTRHCLEVAQTAADAGWKVLHVTGSPAVAELASWAAQTGDSNVLFVYSQTEAEVGVDPQALAQQVRLETKGRTDATIGILAASPNGITAQGGGNEKFTRVQVPFDQEHLDRVTDEVIRHAGRLKNRSDDMLASARTVSGNRPGLAIRIAPELALDPNSYPVGIRKSARVTGTELSQWIAESVDADGLTAADDSDEQVTRAAGIAVAMMAAPQTRQRLQHTVEAGFRHMGTACDDDAGVLVDQLLSRGWLTESNGVLRPLHSVITDQLLLRILLTPEGESLATASHGIFHTAIEDPLTCVRFVEAIRRLVVDHPNPNLPGFLETRCRTWVAENLDHIQTHDITLEQEFPGEPGLIATMLRPGPWRAATLNQLETLSRQYFSGEDTSIKYRVRMSRCLEALDTDNPPTEWGGLAADLVAGELTDTDGELLYTLLRSSGTDGQRLNQIRFRALAWVEEFPFADSVAMVLGLLAKDRSLSKQDCSRVIDRSLAWLARHDTVSGSHMLAALVRSPMLSTPQRDEMWRLLRSWLVSHSTEPDAKFVLRAMLTKPERPGGYYAEALPFTLKWLSANGDNSAAWGISRMVCNDQAISVWWPILLPWLETHATTSPAISPTLCQALSRKAIHISQDKQRQLIRCALSWIQANKDHWTVPEVCKGLAGHSRNPKLKGRERKLRQNLAVTSDQADAILDSLSDWMDRFGPTQVNYQVITALLGYHHARPEPRDRFVAHVLEWLEYPHSVDESERVLAKLARRGGSNARLSEGIIRRAELELASYPSIAHNDELLAGIFLIFGRFPSTARQPLRDRLIDMAVGAADLTDEPQSPGRDRIPPSEILQYLLDIENLPLDRRAMVVDRGVRWIERNSRTKDADKIIRKVLDEPELTGYQAHTIVNHAFEWLDWWLGFENPTANHEGPSTILTRLLARTELDEEDVQTAYEFADKWMSRKDRKKLTAYRRIAEAFLNREGLQPEQTARCLGRVLHAYRSDEEHHHEARRTAVDKAMAWLQEHSALPCASRVLGPALWKVLWENDLSEYRAQVLQAAAHWLEAHADCGPAEHVIKPLLKIDKEGGLPPDFPDLLPLTLRFVEAQGDKWYSARIFPKLCRREDLSDAQRAIISRTAVVWFEGRSSDPTASHVLYGLSRLPLTDEQREFMVNAAVSWALNMIQTIGAKYASGMTSYKTYLSDWDPRFVLRKILARKDLTAAQRAQVLGVALRTHWSAGLRNSGFDWSPKDETDEDLATTPSAGPSTKNGDQPLLWQALEYLATTDNVVEIGPVLAEARSFKLASDQQILLHNRSLTWLVAHAGAEEAGEVCVQLARNLPEGRINSAVLEHSLTWLRAHSGKPAARPLLSFLFRRQLTEEWLHELLPFAEPVLADYTPSKLDGQLLAGVISQSVAAATAIHPFVRLAIDSLRTESAKDGAADALIEALSGCGQLDSCQKAHVVELVVERAGQPKSNVRAGRWLVRCLCHTDPDDAQRDRLFGAMVVWAEAHIPDQLAWPPITSFYEAVGQSEGFGESQIQRARSLLLGVASHAAKHLGGAVFLTQVLRWERLDPSTTAEIHDAAMKWLELYSASSGQTGLVVSALWPLSAKRAGLAQHTVLWLRNHGRQAIAATLVNTIRDSEDFAKLPFRTRKAMEQFMREAGPSQ